MSDFIVNFERIISNFQNNEVILSGDFNINLLNMESKLKYCEFFNMMISKGYLPNITLPTRERIRQRQCAVDRQILTKTQRLRQKGTNRIKDRNLQTRRDRQRDTDKNRQTDTDLNRQRHAATDRDRQTERWRQKDKEIVTK